ncbi:MAG: protein-L-isoaspartate(D-aspartate) O-methyltransferase [Deltaproteobacteria bacterium]
MEILILSSLLMTLVAMTAIEATPDEEPLYEAKRREMVKTQICGRGITDSGTIEAMRRVPRHKFVPQHMRHLSYSDIALPIGMGQTISQPYIVALMTELLNVGKGDRVLEVGTGSGYQAAVLAEMGCDVYTIEIVEPLALHSRCVLREAGYTEIHFKVGDGYLGWEQHAPYDAIIVTAAPHEIPSPLIRQLKEGAKMVIPVGDEFQELILATKKGDGIEEEKITPVKFVPMTGEAENQN